MKKRLATVLFLLGLVLAGPQGWEPLAAQESVARADATEYFYVDWSIQAHGTGMNNERSIEHIVRLSGSAVVRKQFGQFLRTEPFLLTVTDEYYVLKQDNCRSEHEHTSLIDPARYMGGPDPFWDNVGLFEAKQRSDGSWYMDDPFNVNFFQNGQLSRSFLYRTDFTTQDWCSGERDFVSFTLEAAYYALILPASESKPFAGDNTGTIFTRNDQYELGFGDYSERVDFHATIRRVCAAGAALIESSGNVDPLRLSQVCGCSALPQSEIIDNSNPIINSLDVAPVTLASVQIDPDGTREVILVVTCDGRRVRNAEVEVIVKPEERSGSHLHDGDRPRGSLNGVELTDTKPSIKVLSDSLGQVKVQFKPGQDRIEHKRGIAGVYVLKARATRFPYYRPAQANLFVFVPGLSKLTFGAGANYVPTTLISDAHPDAYFGTPATLDAVAGLANAFKRRQEEHNADLRFYSKPEWPVVPLEVWAISLKTGGLFDLPEGGWWGTPYRSHVAGREVQIMPKLGGAKFPGVSEKEATAWFVREYTALGKQYGVWFDDADSPWNLRIGQSSLATEQRNSPAIQGADLAVSALPAHPFGRYAAGAGQAVTFTLGVENVVRDTLAHSVTLRALLPAGLTYQSAAPPPSALAAPDEPVWELGDLAAGGVPRLFDLVAQVEPGIAPGTILTTTVQASMSEVDPTPENNQQEAFGLHVQPPGADLAVSSSLGSTAMIVGRPVTFTVDVANAGNMVAPGTRLTVTLPASATLSSAIPSAVYSDTGHAAWLLGTLMPDASRRVTVAVSLEPSLLAWVALDPDQEPAGVLTFTVEAATSGVDYEEGNNREQVIEAVELEGPDLVLGFPVQGVHSTDILTAGQVFTDTLLYGNFGNQVAPSTTITLSLQAGLQLVGAQPQPTRPGESAALAGDNAAWELGNLPVGEFGMIQLRLRVTALPEAGNLMFATMSSTGQEQSLGDNTAWQWWLTTPTAGNTSQRLFLPNIQHH